MRIVMKNGLRKRVMEGFCLVLTAAAALSGCMSQKSVYIPPEWQKAPPPPAVNRAPQPQMQAPPPESGGQTVGPIFKTPPAIKERDLSTAPEPMAPAKVQPAPQPQYMASMHLVEKANGSLKQKKPDQAIPVLEEAIQVDVYNGDAFFSLARAWRMKGSRNKSMEFAKKAEILFQDQPAKLKEVYLFQADLFKEMGDAASKDLYLKKASTL